MKKYLIILLFFFFFSSQLSAEDLERESLAKIIHVLESLDAYIEVAKANQNKDAVYQNNYEWLRQDIATIKLGVDKMLNGSTSLQPRIFKALRGDYRR